ncbi:hypothetical protein CWC46_14230 [Prodigiosinella confusarubida]|uniref:Uncharacterized protein n=1 Tax=Serratia sp. (strain ATCC 39006) TaxID=104623 RepID=A0A2I5TKT7_SERS3|nr:MULTISPECIES: hypothetical protein [Enterobacterales]AUH00864.1 hypothetical protein CWC46_14230 [Serratia sp. ATCC 39006]AUH05186.1 hypothetical protein Ser39006_014235 [Serratia sp. ATCC 39006]
MAIAQSDFTLYRGKAYEGQISTIDVVEVVSRRVKTALIQFGRAVVRGEAARSCAPVSTTTTANDIIGFSVRSMAEFSNSVPVNPPDYSTGYDVDHTASILRRGGMFALCIDGASAGDTVSVNLVAGENQGRLTTGTGDGLLVLNQVKWVDDVVAGEIGEIRVDGILNA